MTLFHKQTRKLPSPWFPWQQAKWIFPSNFGSLPKGLWYLHILFSRIILTDGEHLYDSFSLNAIIRSRQLMLSFKQNTPQSHNFNVATTKHRITSLFTPFKLINKQRHFWGNYCAFTWQDSWRGDMKSNRDRWWHPVKGSRSESTTAVSH